MKSLYRFRRLALVSAFMLAFGSCKEDITLPTPPAAEGSLMALLSADANFNITTALFNKTGQYLSLGNVNSGVMTLFLPNDAACITYFTTTQLLDNDPNTAGTQALPSPVTEQDIVNWMNEKLTATSSPTIATLNALMNYHIVSSSLTQDLITGNQVFATLNGARLSISKGSTITLNANSPTNGATVVAFDLMASNGVINTIDRVMAVVTTANVLTTLGLAVNYAPAPPAVPPVVTGGTATPDVAFNLFAALLRITGQVPNILPNIVPLPDFTVFQVGDVPMTAYFTAIDSRIDTEAKAYAHMDSVYRSSLTPPTLPAPVIANPTLAQLTDLAKYHVVSGRFVTTDFTNGQVVETTLTGKTFTVGINPVPPAPGPYTYTLTDQNAATDPTISGPNGLTNAGILHTITDLLRPN